MTRRIPSFLLSPIGRMKRPDIRLTWREKVTICLLIPFCCVFIIIFFGKLLCPDLNKAWDARGVSRCTEINDF
jgi:chitin synthase